MAGAICWHKEYVDASPIINKFEQNTFTNDENHIVLGEQNYADDGAVFTQDESVAIKKKEDKIDADRLYFMNCFGFSRRSGGKLPKDINKKDSSLLEENVISLHNPPNLKDSNVFVESSLNQKEDNKLEKHICRYDFKLFGKFGHKMESMWSGYSFLHVVLYAIGIVHLILNFMICVLIIFLFRFTCLNYLQGTTTFERYQRKRMMKGNDIKPLEEMLVEN